MIAARRTPPRLIVEVRGGRANGTKAVIEPGRTLRFGRTELADVAVPGDEMLSGVHFELSWDGERCRLRDRKSHGGTTLGGAPVLTAEVPHGGWIRAGRTDFLVHVEGHSAGQGITPDPDPDIDGDPDRDVDGDDVHAAETAKKLLESNGSGALNGTHDARDGGSDARVAAAEKALWALREIAAREPLYAITDGARDERIVRILRESVERHESLYDGVDGEALEDVAPYLAGPMRADSMLLDRLVLEGWGNRWGILVTSPAPFKEVRRHFRRFLMVEMEETEQKLYFRFYDPVVLERFTNHWTPAQKRDLMDSTSRLLVPDASLGLKAVTP